MKQTEVQAYPLAWPEGWPRTPTHCRQSGARFKSGSTYEGYGDARRYVGQRPVTFAKASRLLADELGRMKATNITVSTNARTRADGGVYASDAEKRYDDPGVAVYFTLKGRQMVMAQDAFDTLAANVRSLGLAVEGLRSLERHGGGTMMERAFSGFTALPAPDGVKAKRPWWIVLGYGDDPEARADLSPDEVIARFKTLAKRRHPDVDGGSVELFVELQTARDDAVRALGG